jgi:hypothetical protein
LLVQNFINDGHFAFIYFLIDGSLLFHKKKHGIILNFVGNENGITFFFFMIILFLPFWL